MKFYLDTADSRQWMLPAGCPPVHGVTTNPALVMQAGLPVSLPGYLPLVAQAGDVRIPDADAATSPADDGEAAQWLKMLQPAAVQARMRLTIKLPCHPDWQPVLREVQARGVPTLLTGLSSPVQWLWARSQGASYVTPYLGRFSGLWQHRLVRAATAWVSGLRHNVRPRAAAMALALNTINT